MNKEELELLDSQIKLMLSIQFIGMSPRQQKYLAGSMADIRIQYEGRGDETGRCRR